MNTAQELGGSEWFRSRFGDAAPTVAAALIRAGRSAHDTSADTKATSGLRTDEPYGATFWQVLALGVVEELAEVQNVRKIRPKGSRFHLPVVAGTTIYAAKCASQSGPEADRLVIRWSQFRDELLSDVERRPEEYLPLEEWQDDEGTEELVSPTSEAEAVVLVAFVASDRAGLERIHIGDGYLDGNGAVIWLHHEELPVEVALDLDVTDEASEPRRFDEAPMRSLDMAVREDDDLARGSQ
ncbi:hypothetical protein [Microbacterium foliorum]|uniref:Uncharacterized protein n=1 Tax=Microbacterium foliorum TaxID=104336 RepID=A0A0F0KTL8_9MICO|nr:hypothetical protein [Microbacterium foliorum]KJL24203.1 hypothetical protein RN50_00783 [Microbacterium foliorum]